MTLRKNISGADLVTPFVDGEVAAGATVETPDVQADGSGLIWDPTIWQDDEPAVQSHRRAPAVAAPTPHSDEE